MSRKYILHSNNKLLIPVKGRNQNFSIVGTGTKITNGIANGFTDTSFVKAEGVSPTDLDVWEINTCVFNHNVNTTGNWQGIFGGDNNYRGVEICSYGKEKILRINLSSNGTNRNIANMVPVNVNLPSDDTKMWIRVGCDGSKLFFEYKTSLTDSYTRTWEMNKPSIYPSTGVCFGNRYYNWDKFDGSIDLNYTNIKVGNTILWQPYTPKLHIPTRP